ncbi:MAG: hypothetical protein PHF37_06270 [Phycisphaerae bacterium]|nr:hypothetical protein [Phycisphaerae bacterium]
MERREFRIVPAGMAFYLSLLVILVLLCVPFVSLIFAFKGQSGGIADIMGWIGLAVLGGTAGLFLFLIYSITHGRFIVDENGFRAKGFLYGRKIDRSKINADGIL